MVKRHKRKPKHKHIKRAIEQVSLREMVREAAKVGAAEAIEHCANFWNVSDGYKRYIDQQVSDQAEALKAAMRAVLRGELAALVSLEIQEQQMEQLRRRKKRKKR